MEGGRAALPVARVGRGPPASSYTFLKRTYNLPWHPQAAWLSFVLKITAPRL